MYSNCGCFRKGFINKVDDDGDEDDDDKFEEDEKEEEGDVDWLMMRSMVRMMRMIMRRMIRSLKMTLAAG